jgi:pyruvate decarboxylase
MTSDYNDVPSWRYIDAPSFFGAQIEDSSYPIFAKRAETWGQLLEILAEEKANDANGLKIIDIVVHPEDVPSAAIPGLQRASEALRSR